MKLHLLVRDDLDTGLAAAQAVHAALEYVRAAFERFRADPGANFLAQEQPPVVIATVKAAKFDNGQLLYELRAVGEVFVTWEEPDLGGQLTAVAFVASSSPVKADLLS